MYPCHTYTLTLSLSFSLSLSLCLSLFLSLSLSLSSMYAGIFFTFPEGADPAQQAAANASNADGKSEIMVTTNPLAVTAITVNLTRKLLFVAFENGEIRVYGYPHIDPLVSHTVVDLI